jgi:hypothetical protein
MKIEITLYCPDCQSAKVKKNGKKSYGKQNYLAPPIFNCAKVAHVNLWFGSEGACKGNVW